MTKVTESNQKTNLEKFHMGFRSFVSMYASEHCIVFTCRSPALVKECAKDAEKRIAELQLPLTVVPSKYPLNDFTVKEVAA